MGDTENYTKILSDIYNDIFTLNKPKIESITKGLIRMNDYSKKTNYQFQIFMGFIIVFILIFGYYVFFFNPYKILNYIQLPLIIIFFILLFYCIYYLFHINKIKKNQSINLSYESIFFTQIFFKLIGICIAILIIFLVVFTLLQTVLITTLNISFFLSLAILFIIIAFLDKWLDISSPITTESNNEVVVFLTNLIFYIPCLIIDFIEFIKKDYKDTPSTTIILFFILLIIFTIYIYIFYNKIKKNKDGIILVNDSKYLNTNIITLNKEELNRLILENKPFYERELYKIQIKKKLSDANNAIYTDISNEIEIIQPPSVIPYYADKYSRDKYKEGFTSVLIDETFPVHLTIDEYDKYILQQLLWNNPDINNNIKQKMESSNDKDIGIYINDLIEQNKDIISFYEKSMLYLSTTFNPNFTKNLINNLEENNYHYSFSFWLYLVPIQNISNKKDIIYTYGNRPSMYFNHTHRELTLEYNNYENNTTIVLYKTNNILYQKWNNIVINNNYGTYDIFINGNLMGSYKNIINYKIYPNEILKIGSNKNKDIGGISNFYYYENPLDLNKIIEIYKSPPHF
jgi:hypothetical protein